jgi:hypothetical protein
MRSLRKTLLFTATAFAAIAGRHAVAAPAVSPTYQHVLLISVDGMHAIDLNNWIAANPNSNIAKLAAHGIIYPNAFTTAPSDSYPGMLAQVTGGSPLSGGLFYDDSYDRKEYPSKNYWISQGMSDPGCTGSAGTEVTNFEELDKGYNFSTQLVSDLTGGGTLDQVYTQLDPDNMQRKIDAKGACVPVYPHDYVRTNTIFEVIKAAGGYTAWSDKHPAYEDLAGPSGKGLDELFAPEINSQDTLDPGAQTGDDYTTSYTGVRTYDSIKVHAVLNWIDGFNAVGTQKLSAAPAVFGMNFQSVSVGQKLAHAGDADTNKRLTGGYLNGNATPGNALTLQLNFVDASIGAMESELVRQGIADSTLFIISAKHGQSPIDRRLRVTQSDSGFQGEPGFGSNGFEICDDEALIWLSPEQQQTPGTYAAAEAYLKANATSLNIEYLLDRTSLTPLYGDPFHNTRVPDFIAVTKHGVICTGGSKLAEHGGFSDDDRNVALLVSAPRIKAETVESLTYTTQIAPTILYALGLDSNALQAVQREGTQVLSH